MFEASRAGELGFDQCPQDFLRCPPLCLGDEQYFGCGAADRSKFESPQPGNEISRQIRNQLRCNGNGSTRSAFGVGVGHDGTC